MSTDDWREMAKKPIRRALISVYDKTGLIELAQGLAAAGVEIVSTGSTAKTIADQGIPVTRVEELTGFPEVLDGRVKTLHPRVHAGLLADLRKPEHAAALEQLGIAPFELVVVNLYPFSETVDSGAGIDECVEQIDIGGPSMVRAAAKNHPSVAVVTDPLGYDGVLAAVQHGGFTLAERKKLASLAFQHTAEYDIAVASWMESTLAPEHPPTAFPKWFGRGWRRSAMLRYGENPHQQAALYGDPGAWPGLAQAEQLHGKEMSYNNFTDADAAWRAAFDHEQIMRGNHQARQPMWDRHLVGVGGRRASQGPRMRSAERLRRGDRGEHRGQRRDGGVREHHFHRSDRRARLCAGCPGRADAQKEHPGPGRLRAADRW